MSSARKTRPGRHFLQIPGPTNVPDRVLRAMTRPTIDHRSAEFAELARRLLGRLQGIFKTAQPVLLFPSSGSGALEAALVNTFSPGDRLLMFETGYFAASWRAAAERLGLEIEWVPGDWRQGVSPQEVERRLSADSRGAIRGVAMVHNETSTGVTSRLPEIREAIDQVGHPALLLVDTISSLGSIDYCHDEWQVDVSVGCSQKGLMLPPGLGLCAVSAKALEAHHRARLPRSYWDWTAVLESHEHGFFPYSPPTNLLYGLDEALELLLEEGLDEVFRRHDRLAEATRRAVRQWQLELVCDNPNEYSSSVTAVLMPDGRDADAFRELVLERFDLSLGAGLGKVKGRVFRIGHLGSLNELMLVGTLAGVEMGLRLAGVADREGGVAAAMDYLSSAKE